MRDLGVVCTVVWGALDNREAGPMLDIQIGLHVFLIVLVFGTIWRLAQFHLMASPNPSLQHLGKAMSIQF